MVIPAEKMLRFLGEYAEWKDETIAAARSDLTIYLVSDAEQQSIDFRRALALLKTHPKRVVVFAKDEFSTVAREEP